MPFEIADLLDCADGFVELSRKSDKKLQLLKGLTHINLFFEPSTRTQTSFELAGKRLGRRRRQHGGPQLVDQQGRDPDRHRHDAQRHAPGRAGGPPRRQSVLWRSSPATSAAPSSTPATAATSTRPRRCSTRSRSAASSAGSRASRSRSAATSSTRRVARSNILLLTTLGARVRVVAPPTLLPVGRGGPRRAGLHRHAARPRGRRRRDDAAAPDRAHAGQLRPVGAGVFPLLRPDLRQAARRQAARHDHAPGADEPRRRDRRRGGRRHRAQRRSSSRSRWAWRCGWPASTC